MQTLYDLNVYYNAGFAEHRPDYLLGVHRHYEDRGPLLVFAIPETAHEPLVLWPVDATTEESEKALLCEGTWDQMKHYPSEARLWAFAQFFRNLKQIIRCCIPGVQLSEEAVIGSSLHKYISAMLGDWLPGKDVLYSAPFGRFTHDLSWRTVAVNMVIDDLRMSRPLGCRTLGPGLVWES